MLPFELGEFEVLRAGASSAIAHARIEEMGAFDEVAATVDAGR